MRIYIHVLTAHGVIAHINQQKQIYFYIVRELVEPISCQTSDAISCQTSDAISCQTSDAISCQTSDAIPVMCVPKGH